MRWVIPITIIEYGRLAIIEAPTAKDAMAIFRRHGWDECTDASDHKVTKVGAIRREDPE